ncbi:MAG TPA: 7-cyano-7-deazaguanine synthase [Candidatus Binataceae bacterium]|jgi:7-cyano-7-deazaguanine synthase|nr:7-cyano-7-deazaguanine synthase [Candidatus Binataceae bacterium]
MIKRPAAGDRDRVTVATHSSRNSHFLMRDYRIKPVPGRVAVLASGGLDSSVMLARIAQKRCEVFPVYIRTGLVWEKDELAMLRRFIKAVAIKSIQPLTVLNVPMDDVAAGHWSMTGKKVPGYRAALSSNYIPGRNLTLLSKAAVFCARNRIGDLAMALLEANPFPDARPAFFEAMSKAVDIGVGLRLKISTPWVGKSKPEVIALGRDLPLQLSVSCIKARGAVHCRQCTKCAERIEGFRLAGVKDPTRYRS